MAILNVLRFPDPFLRQQAKDVAAINDELKLLAADMIETMHHYKGIGLAAIQVGHKARLLVVDITKNFEADGDNSAASDIAGDPEQSADESKKCYTELELQVDYPLALFNAKIITASGKTTYQEGCLSVPTFYETVERYAYVEVAGITLEGEPTLIKADGLLAIVLQHEIDHLDGKLFIDRLSLIKSTRIKNRIRKEGYHIEEQQTEDGVDL